MKHKLKNALIGANIIRGDNSENETLYVDAVFDAIKDDDMFGYVENYTLTDAFINPETIEFAFESFPNAHILDFFADDCRLLMFQFDNQKEWQAKRVFLGNWEGHEKIVEKYKMPFLFEYPNPEYGLPPNEDDDDPLIMLKNTRVYHMAN